MNRDYRVLVHDRVLRESRTTHEVQEVLAFAVESTSTIWHDSFTLRSSNGSTKIRLARFAELALSAFGGVELYGRYNLPQLELAEREEGERTGTT